MNGILALAETEGKKGRRRRRRRRKRRWAREKEREGGVKEGEEGRR